MYRLFPPFKGTGTPKFKKLPERSSTSATSQCAAAAAAAGANAQGGDSKPHSPGEGETLEGQGDLVMMEKKMEATMLCWA